MSNIDPELLNDFLTEMKTLEREIAPIVESLKKNSEQSELFEKFGNIVGSIYGVAASFGMKELASYCGTLKKTCADCAKAKNTRANGLVLKLLESYLENLASLLNSIKNPEEAKKINFTIHLEEQKAKKIHEQVFKFIKM